MPGLRLLTADAALAEAKDAIVHRPYQVNSSDDLQFLLALGERLILTHLDLIAYRNPAYFHSTREWTKHRRLTHEALALADVVMFCTHQGARDALADGLVDERRVRIVPPGADHRPTQARPPGPGPREGSRGGA